MNRMALTRGVMLVVLTVLVIAGALHGGAPLKIGGGQLWRWNLNAPELITYGRTRPIRDLNNDQRPDVIECNSQAVNVYYFNRERVKN